MRALQLARPGDRLSVLCLGAHSDDIEIGAGATLLGLMERGVRLDVHWCVLSGGGVRDDEARKSAMDFLAKAASAEIEIKSFRDGFFPEQGEAVKQWFESLKGRIDPDLILTHRRDDAHQDHRQVCQLTWNTFRDHQILEYEIPKWDGDIGQPNVYVPVSVAALERKIELLMAHFGSQRSKQWFDDETFRGLARIRGMECRAPERYAEAFFARKVALI
ncbi:PIG-L deacetylase family protein [Bradyrhizobium sp.]|uniref:PIG-L deacetylase family protein n=1 Tax=Bradyrhizobium sp. TaxID=376 RepID=UPI001DEBF6CB|nr:PIG-L deacetylase family protein [Bradyrhizobium sp.]MBI5320213.1 PIG-L family deacetylase [Bradyrhizobium sp.]